MFDGLSDRPVLQDSSVSRSFVSIRIVLSPNADLYGSGFTPCARKPFGGASLVSFGAGNISEYFGGYFCSARIRRLGSRVVDGADVPSLDVHYASQSSVAT